MRCLPRSLPIYLFLSILACRDRQVSAPPSPGAAAGATTVLAKLPAEERSPAPVEPSGLGLHWAPPAANPGYTFGERGGGVAFVAEQGERLQVLHNGRAGTPYEAVGVVALSPDGRRCAYGALAGGAWRMVVDGQEGQPFSAVRQPVFSLDGAHLAYQAMSGERWYLVVDGKPDAGTPTRYLQHEFAADGARILFITDGDDQDRGELVVADLAMTARTPVAERVTAFVMNPARTRGAAVQAEGRGRRVLTFTVDRPALVKAGPIYDDVQGPVFGPDGASVAYLAQRAGRALVVLDGREEPLPPGGVVLGGLVVRAGGLGVGALVADATTVRLRQFLGEAWQGGNTYEEAEGLTYGEDGRLSAFAARRGQAWFVVVDGREGPSFDRVVTPQLRGDRLVYRARQAGKRFVVIADRAGRTIRQAADHEQVFPVRLAADGRSAGYGVKDGRQLGWVVEAL